MSYDQTKADLVREVDELNLALASGRDIIRAQRDTIDRQSLQLADRDRVIARLLDGWEHDVTSSPPVWWKGWASAFEENTAYDKSEPMSDGEAAIIRQDQERTT
jgi:hypothetical protein